MRFAVKEVKRDILKLEEGQEVAIVFEDFVTLKYGEAIAGRIVDDGRAVFLPLTATLEKLKNNDLERGDVIAIKNNGMVVSKDGRRYKNISYTIYRKGIDFEPDEIPF